LAIDAGIMAADQITLGSVSSSIDMVNSIATDVNGGNGSATGAEFGKAITDAAIGVLTERVGSAFKALKGTSAGKYSNVPNPKNVKEGGNFTRAQKRNILNENKQQNGGVFKSDKSGKTLDTPTQSKKGQKANMNQAEVDHIKPKSKGGSNSSSNAQVLSKEENLRKGNR
jgi:hypothetical protein